MRLLLIDQKQWTDTAGFLVNSVKPYIWIASIVWAASKVYAWIKDILTTTQRSVTCLQEELKVQTDAVVRELTEMRNDFRSFFTMFYVQPAVRNRALDPTSSPSEGMIEPSASPVIYTTTTTIYPFCRMSSRVAKPNQIDWNAVKAVGRRHSEVEECQSLNRTPWATTVFSSRCMAFAGACNKVDATESSAGKEFTLRAISGGV